jgi:hypothetical protein
MFAMSHRRATLKRYAWVLARNLTGEQALSSVGIGHLGWTPLDGQGEVQPLMVAG